MEEIKNKKVLFVIGAILLLILVIGASFAYFQIVTNNNATNTTISGKGDLVGQATLTTNITELKLKLTAEMMSKDNIGKTYYATETGEGVTEPTLGNGEYILATASLTESDVSLNCNYSYDISISSTKPITTEASLDMRLTITEPSGIVTSNRWFDLQNHYNEHTAPIYNLTFNAPQNIKIKFSVYNSSDSQNDLSGNEFTITLTPKSGTEGFSCNIPTPLQESYSLTSDTDVSQMNKTGLLFSGDDFVKISDDIPTPNDLSSALIVMETHDGEKIETALPVLPIEKNVTLFGTTVDLGLSNIFGMIINNTPEPNVDYDLSDAEPGLYLRYNPTTIKEITLKFPKIKKAYELTNTTDITNVAKVAILDEEGSYYVKVSEDTLSYDEFLNSGGSLTSIDGEKITQRVTEDLIVYRDENILITQMGIIVYNPTEFGGMTFTEAGIYLVFSPEFIKEIRLLVYE